MAPMPKKYHAPTLSVCHVAQQMHVASPMDYAGIQGTFCFGGHVETGVGAIPIAQNSVSSVGRAHIDPLKNRD